MRRNARTLAALAAGLLLLIAGWWLASGAASEDRPDAPDAQANAETPSAGHGDGSDTATPSGSATRAPQQVRALGSRATTYTQVEHDLVDWRALYAPQGMLTVDATRALVARRDAAAESIATRIGLLPEHELHRIVEAWHDARHTRDKLLMIAGLGRSRHDEAVRALETIYEGDAGFTSRSHVLRALGDSPAQRRLELLVDTMWNATDERLSQLAAQSLYGEHDALQPLVDAVSGGLPLNTRLEAIHSLGATKSDAARAALEAFAADAGLEPRLRQYAQRELERSFGA